MSYCIQCGEELRTNVATCPTCGRPVGESSIGQAKERQAPAAALKMLGGLAAVVAALAGAAVLLVMLQAKPRLDRAQLDRLASVAAPSLVTVGEGDAAAGGVVVRAEQGAVVVATLASKAPVGREVKVTHDGKSARGFGLIAGAGMAKEFALVLVPDGAALGVAEARLSPMPKVDDLVATFDGKERGAGSGHVLSFEDGPGAGTLVHDAPVDPDARGFGLWTRDGRLEALSVMDESAGAQLAVASEALFERLLVREVPLVPGVEWSETALPLRKGTRVAAVLEGPTSKALATRLGAHGQVTRGREVWPGLASLELNVAAPAPLELAGAAPAGGAPAKALVVVLDRI